MRLTQARCRDGGVWCFEQRPSRGKGTTTAAAGAAISGRVLTWITARTTWESRRVPNPRSWSPGEAASLPYQPWSGCETGSSSVSRASPRRGLPSCFTLKTYVTYVVIKRESSSRSLDRNIDGDSACVSVCVHDGARSCLYEIAMTLNSRFCVAKKLDALHPCSTILGSS